MRNNTNNDDYSYAYYRHPIDCPECGRPTHELFNVIVEGEPPVLMCQECQDREVQELEVYDEE